MCDRNGCGCGGEAPPGARRPRRGSTRCQPRPLRRSSSAGGRALVRAIPRAAYEGRRRSAAASTIVLRGAATPVPHAPSRSTPRSTSSRANGWPAFFDNYPGTLTRIEHGKCAQKIEITCSGCGGGAGASSSASATEPTHERHCVGSISLAFAPPGGFFIAAEDNVEARGELHLEKARRRQALAVVTDTHSLGLRSARAGSKPSSTPAPCQPQRPQPSRARRPRVIESVSDCTRFFLTSHPLRFIAIRLFIFF